MDVILDSSLSVHQKQVFNQIRLYMKLITASDLFDTTNNCLKSNVLGCKHPMTPILGFPYIRSFPSSWTKLWDAIILSMILPCLFSLPLDRKLSQSHLETTLNGDVAPAENQDRRISLSPKDLRVTSTRFQRAVEYIHHNIKTSESWKRHIWGNSILSPRVLCTTIKLAISKNLIIATDASVDQGKAAHAFCFAEKKKGRVIFTSGSKVAELESYLTSYRAEMISIIAATELITLILRTVGVSDTRVDLYTDSDTSIMSSKNTKLNTLHFVLSNDIGVALQLKQTLDNNKHFLSRTE